MTQLIHPTGWWCGANMQSAHWSLPNRVFYGQEMTAAMGLLQPEHTFTWWYDQPGVDLGEAAWHLLNAGYDVDPAEGAIDGHAVMLLSEPSRGWMEAVNTPENATEFILEQYAGMWAGGQDWVPIWPNDLAGAGGFEFWDAAMPLLRHRGLRTPVWWGWHIYAETCDGAIMLWDRLKRWLERWRKDQPVIITETALMNAPADEQKRYMDFLRQLLDAGEVAGVCWFNALPYLDPGVYYEGLCRIESRPEGERVVLTELGEHWLSLKGSEGNGDG